MPTAAEIQDFVRYCNKSSLNFASPAPAQFQSLVMCIIDAIYSLRARYYSVTVPIEDRYAATYMGGDRFASNENCSDFLDHIVAQGGAIAFAKTILRNNQQLAGRNKAEVCINIANMFISLGIETISDFHNYQRLHGHQEIENRLIGIRGVGPAATNYLFMLAGDPNRVKTDVWIRRFTRDALGNGYDRKNDAFYQALFSAAVSNLRKSYPTLTIARLDNLIWESYR